jgi:hypothetical protein
MDDRIVTIALSAVTAIITGWISYRFWIAQQLREIERDYDRELRASRLPAYQELWKEFEPLAVYAPAEAVTYERLRELGVTLRTWYFHTGGLLFTKRARDAYFLVQDAIDGAGQGPARGELRSASRHWTRTSLDAAREPFEIPSLPSPSAGDDRHDRWQRDVRAIVAKWRFGDQPENDFVLVQFLASSLRTLLADDLRAREPSMLRPRG